VQHLGDYDLLITHYGITAFEALYAGISVILASPGSYHEKLAKRAGFFSLGIGKIKTCRISGLLIHKKTLNNSFLKKIRSLCEALSMRHNLHKKNKQNLACLINDFDLHISRKCTVCSSLLDNCITGRFNDRTYYRCPECRVINMNRFTPAAVKYNREYFFDLYKKQYGKTYIEDFPNLIDMAKKRLKIIKKIVKTQSSASTLLLDIGCAYGAFLVAAKETGFSSVGMDPSKDAVSFAGQTPGIRVMQGSFPCFSPFDNAEFSVVTLWYVIEHFTGCMKALHEIKRILKPGGTLAFSTPSYSGISGISSIDKFLMQSPDDHFTIWSLSACKKALKQAGFSVKKIISTGHHPERFPFLGRFCGSKKSPLYIILYAISRIFRLGDTFEVYAVLK
jgi:2-polyprenyl-3-methyl-5-hydroxy-6-metoxy-1,4-benzoquinol methylase